MRRTVHYLTVAMSFGLFISVQPTSATEQINSQVWRKMAVLATAYCPCRKCCGKSADGITAIGADAYTKGVAVDRNLIPLGSTVVVPEYGTVMADDVGGAIKKNHIDVRFQSHQTALEWGRQWITIYYRTPWESPTMAEGLGATTSEPLVASSATTDLPGAGREAIRLLEKP